jgi:hypothetical protein
VRIGLPVKPVFCSVAPQTPTITVLIPQKVPPTGKDRRERFGKAAGRGDKPLIDAILEFDEDCINLRGQQAISAARNYYRKCLTNTQDEEPRPSELTERGQQLLSGSITAACRAIRGSYFGMLQGQWPLHLLRRKSLPADAFSKDTVRCRIHGNNQGEWKFVPVQFQPDDPAWFELEFSLPPLIAELVQASWNDPVRGKSEATALFVYRP